MGKKVRIHQLYLTLCLLVMSMNAFTQSSQEQILAIQGLVGIIDADTSFTVNTLYHEEFEETSCNGALLEGFYEKGELRRITDSFGMSNGMHTWEYYFFNHELVFVYEKQEVFYYNMEKEKWDYDSIHNLFEGRYYFGEKKLIQANRIGKLLMKDSVSVDVSMLESSLLFEAEHYADLLSRKKVKHKAYEEMLDGLLDHTVDEICVREIEDSDSSIIFLDARERKEFEVSHIRGAVWVGYDDFHISRLDSIDKSSRIVVYCSVGYRSEKISEKLIKADYTNVSNLYGSIFEWVNQGRRVCDMDGNVTEDIHAFDLEWSKWLDNGVKVYN